MNKVIIVEASDSDRRLMSGLLTRAGYEPIVVEDMEAAKQEVTKLSPGAVIVSAMKFRGGTAKELINWLREEGYKFPLLAYDVFAFGEQRQQISQEIAGNESNRTY